MLLVVTAIVVVGLRITGGGESSPASPDGEPAATVTAGDSGLPPADLFLPRPLDEAIEQLEDAVSR